MVECGRIVLVTDVMKDVMKRLLVLRKDVIGVFITNLGLSHPSMIHVWPDAGFVTVLGHVSS